MGASDLKLLIILKILSSKYNVKRRQKNIMGGKWTLANFFYLQIVTQISNEGHDIYYSSIKQSLRDWKLVAQPKTMSLIR